MSLWQFCKSISPAVRITAVKPDNIQHITASKPVSLRTSKLCHLRPLALLEIVKSTCGEHHFSRVANCYLETLLKISLLPRCFCTL